MAMLGMLAGSALSGLGQGLSSWMMMELQQSYTKELMGLQFENSSSLLNQKYESMNRMQQQQLDAQYKQIELRAQMAGMNTPASLMARNANTSTISNSGTYDNAGAATLRELYPNFVSSNHSRAVSTQTRPDMTDSSTDSTPPVEEENILQESSTIEPEFENLQIGNTHVRVGAEHLPNTGKTPSDVPSFITPSTLKRNDTFTKVTDSATEKGEGAVASTAQTLKSTGLSNTPEASTSYV